MKSYLQRMFAWVAWADARSAEALRNTPAAHDQALPIFAHLLAAEHVWLARLQLSPPRHAVWPKLTLDECRVLAAENLAGYAAYLSQLSDDSAGSTITYRTSQGQEFATSVIDILTQVITHGPYHRGQIARIIGQSGGTALNTDFITFTREVPGIP